jgi:hypothetical protein
MAPINRIFSLVLHEETQRREGHQQHFIAYKVWYYGEFVRIMVSYLDFQKLNFVAFTKLWRLAVILTNPS